jgi:protocatechuate 4,5-dioxygenase beta chain
MATVVGCICTSHVRAIGEALAEGLHTDSYWQPFLDAFPPVRSWLDRVQPDIAVVFYNDHGLNFFLDNIPTFAIGAAEDYLNSDEGWGIPPLGLYPGEPQLSWHVMQSLVSEEFDPSSCQRMLVDHAFSIPMRLLWPDRDSGPRASVPIAINTIQHPLPSPRRCYKLGQAVGRAIASYPQDAKVVVIGSGGLSHRLESVRAANIDESFNLMCMDKLVDDPAALIRYSIQDLEETTGSRGVELNMWIAARAAMTGSVSRIHGSYHTPISNTAAGLLLLENRDAIPFK